MHESSTALVAPEQHEEALERAGGRDRLPVNYAQRGPAGIRQSDDVALLMPAFARAQMSFPNIVKDRTAVIEGRGNYQYRYANLADVQNAVGPVLHEHKLSFMMIPTGTRLIGRLIHESGQYIEGDLPIVQADGRGGAQALGSALTYAKRYLMSAMLGLVLDDEDDDGAAASRQPARSQQVEQRQPPAPAPTPTAKELGAMLDAATSAASCFEVLRDAGTRPKLRFAAWSKLLTLAVDPGTVDDLSLRFHGDKDLPGPAVAQLVILAAARRAALQNDDLPDAPAATREDAHQRPMGEEG